MNAELGDYIEVDLGGLIGKTLIKLVTPDSVEIANEILKHESGWRLIKDEEKTS